jgi:polar amino acid transport system permease protein
MIRRPRDWNRVISIGMTVGAVVIAVPWLWNKYENRPLWWDPVQHQIIHTGLAETLRMAAISVVGAAAVGLVLGTLLTISFKPSRVAHSRVRRVWRGLPIIVTIFLIYFALPRVATSTQLSAFEASTVGLILWGSAQVAEATRGAVESIPRDQHEARRRSGSAGPDATCS